MKRERERTLCTATCNADLCFLSRLYQRRSYTLPPLLPPLLLLLIRVVLVILTLEISMRLISSFWCYHLQLFLLVNFLCCDTVSVSQFARTVVDEGERERESLPACLQIRRLVCRLCNSGAAFIDIVFLFSLSLVSMTVSLSPFRRLCQCCFGFSAVLVHCCCSAPPALLYPKLLQQRWPAF